MPQRKKIRRMWTDAQKEALIKNEALHQGSLREFLDPMHVNGSWFRDMRRKFLKAHPEIDLTLKGSLPLNLVANVPVVKMANGWPVDPEERKQEMRRRIAKAKANRLSAAKPKASYSPAVLDPATASAMDAYRSLPHLAKAAWRKARHLSSAQVYQISHGLSTPNIVARVLSVNGNGDQRLARIPDPITVIPNGVPNPAYIPVSLDDAILAFEVKQDHMMEFIEQLKRMRSGRNV